MTTPSNPPTGGSFYSKLIDNEGGYDDFGRSSEAGPAAQPVSPIRLFLGPRGPGPFRLATICLATLCVILFICLISIAAHKKSSAQGGGDGGEASAQLQRQEQGAGSALTEDISRLQQEKEQLQKEKEQLQREKEQLQKEREQLQKEKEKLQKEKEQLQAATTAPEVVRTPSTIVCPADWHLFNSSCYMVSRNSRDWPESKSFCESQGAHLAIILTAEEQTFLWNLLPRGHWNAFWFGITDSHTEDEWKWVDGTPLVGGFWEVGEPNNHIDEDCGYIVKTRVLERVAIRSWYDAPCGMNLPFICEKYMGPGASTALPH